MKRLSLILLSLASIFIGLYPLLYFFLDRKFGLLQSKPDALLNNISWNIGFYTHIILGGIALLVGWVQFFDRIRINRPTLHKFIGRIYTASCLLSALSGFYIALSATGGILSSLGFMMLSIVWFSSTLAGFLSIKKGQVLTHRVMMIYSYAACCSAITLRIYLPLLVIYFNSFQSAYITVAWLCWLPNILVAYVITTSMKKISTKETSHVL